jgi:hypothetical protein
MHCIAVVFGFSKILGQWYTLRIIPRNSGGPRGREQEFSPRQGGSGWLWDLWWTEGVALGQVFSECFNITSQSFYRGWYSGLCTKRTQSYLTPRTFKKPMWYFREISLRMVWDDLPLLAQALEGWRPSFPRPGMGCGTGGPTPGLQLHSCSLGQQGLLWEHGPGHVDTSACVPR